LTFLRRAAVLHNLYTAGANSIEDNPSNVDVGYLLA